MGGKPVQPCRSIEVAITIINEVFAMVRQPYWLCFGGLYAIIKNNGVIPDGDLDICTYYGADWKRIVRGFESYGYKMSKAILDDSKPENILYCGFNKPSDRDDLLHVCLSFWYPAHGKRWWCHDEKFDLKVGDVGVPKSGYYLKGCDADIVEGDNKFVKVQYPGIPGRCKISVPVQAGRLLDACYIGWPYKYQAYEVRNNEVQEDKLVSYFKGNAISQYMVHLKSIKHFQYGTFYQTALAEGANRYQMSLKKIVSTSR